MAEVRSHARHDRFAIAASLGDGSISATVGACPACGALHRDLLSIQTALRHAWTPRRPRDLRLSAAEAARLRPVLWRRLLGAFAWSRDAVTRPLAIGLTGLGIAGLVVANVPLGLIVASGAASVTVPPETTMAVDPSGVITTTTEQQRGEGTPEPDPVMVLSAVSFGAGATILGLRRLAGRSRGCVGDAMIRNRARDEAV